MIKQSLSRRLLLSVATGAAMLVVSSTATAQSARDYISIVGSSTVYPFTTMVSEQFGRQGSFKTPKVESTGTGGGIKLFCNGVGVQHPDMANASRRMNAGEFDTCKRNGVTDVVEMKVGYDGIVLAISKSAKPIKLTRKQVYFALAKQIPDPSNTSIMMPNPYTKWSDIDKSLPAVKIEVLGPPPTSGTRDSFAELYMEAGCRTFPWLNTLRGLDEKRFKRICHTMREDGGYVEAGENDNLIVQKINANLGALGIFGFSYLDENSSTLRGVEVDGVSPTFETIAAAQYPASRPLFVYIKKAHIGVIPGIKEYTAEYLSDKSLGAEGYLPARGLISPTKGELAGIRAGVAALKTFTP